MFRAFLKAGVSCAAGFIGDWAFAAWSAVDRRLWLSVGDGGTWAFYYHTDRNTLAFATGIQHLLRFMPADPVLDEIYVAQVLTNSRTDSAATAYTNVRRVIGLHTLEWQVGSAPVVAPYWSPEAIPAVVRSPQDLADGLKEVLSTSLRNRLGLHSAIGSTLSGGLDSTAVTALAAQILGERQGRITAYTSVPAFDAATCAGRASADEGELAASVARFHTNIDHVRVDCAGRSPVQAIRRGIRDGGLPIRNVANQLWSYEILDRAHAEGLDLLLIAQGGNITISWPGDASVEKPLPIRLRALASNVARRAADRFHSLRGRPGWGSIQATGHSRSPLASDLAAEISWDRRMMPSAAYDPGLRKPISRGLRFWTSQRPQWAHYASAAGIATFDPTMDRRVVAYTWSIPDIDWKRPLPRWPLRLAMTGLVPDEVRLNTRPGLQSADIIFRLLDRRRELEDFYEEVSSSRLAARYVDLPYCWQVWEHAREHPSPQTRTRVHSILLRGLSVAHFIAEFERLRRRPA